MLSFLFWNCFAFLLAILAKQNVREDWLQVLGGLWGRLLYFYCLIWAAQVGPNPKNMWT